MNITVAILDDDLLLLSVLEEKIRQVLEEYELNVSIDCFTDWEKLESDNKIYDLFFSDIVLPGLDGISLADRLQKNGRVRDVIYVSGYDSEVFRTFGSHPVAFVRKEHLKEDLKKAAALYHEHLKEMWVIIPEGRKKHLMRMDDIIYISSQNHYVEIHMSDGEQRVIRSKLDMMECMLEKFGFMRVHISYLVNLKYVLSMNRSQIYLKNKESIKISVKYKQQVFDTMRKNFVEIWDMADVQD